MEENQRKNRNTFCTKDGVFHREGEGVMPTKIADYMKISKVIANIDTNERTAILEYESMGILKSIEVKRVDYLNGTNIMKLQGVGVDVLPYNYKLLIPYLRDEEEEAERVFVHNKLGFDKYENKRIYKHYSVKGLNSTYSGPLKIKPTGSYGTWLEMFHKEVKDSPTLMLMVCASLSSVIVEYLGDYLGRESQIIHVVGDSTTGKSTGCKLAISAFGYPDVDANGLFTTYNATDNAIMKILAGKNGVPIALDELSMSSMKNQGGFIYKLANGTNKARLNQDSSIKERETWNGTILSNGEKSLINSSLRNPGLMIRVIELSNVSITRDAEQAEYINEVCRNNYGYIGPKFANFVLEQEEEQVKKLYEKVKEYLLKTFKKEGIVDAFTPRRVKKFAIILTAQRLLSKMLKTKLEHHGMVKLFVQIEKESILLRNIDRNIIELLQEYISLNIKKFSTSSSNAIGENWGKIIEKDNYVEVAFSTIKFEEMLGEFKYEDKNVVLKKLKDEGYLDCEKGRLTRKRKNDEGVVSRYYVIKLPQVSKNDTEFQMEEHPLDNLE